MGNHDSSGRRDCSPIALMHSSPSTCAGDFENDSCFLSLYETVMKNRLPRLKRLHTCRLYTTVPSYLIIFTFLKIQMQKNVHKLNHLLCIRSLSNMNCNKTGYSKAVLSTRLSQSVNEVRIFFFKVSKNHLNVCLL